MTLEEWKPNEMAQYLLTDAGHSEFYYSTGENGAIYIVPKNEILPPGIEKEEGR